MIAIDDEESFAKLVSFNWRNAERIVGPAMSRSKFWESWRFIAYSFCLETKKPLGAGLTKGLESFRVFRLGNPAVISFRTLK